MYLSWEGFLQSLSCCPGLVWVSAGLVGVLLINGWTDAPNAIACAVVTGALPFPRALLLAAACNFAGVVFSCTLFPSVAETVYSMVSLSGPAQRGLCALGAALLAAGAYSAIAWCFGLPTSESHGLLAGVSGAAVALEGNMGCIRWESWLKVLFGLGVSLILGLALGREIRRRLAPLPLSHSTCRRLLVPGAAVSAFLHGAQDAQKLLGIFLLACSLAGGGSHLHSFLIPRWLMVLCALLMALGTACGGGRIIDTVARDMVRPDPLDAVACDLAGNLCLALSTVLGLPVSTTHTKTAALLGAGRESGGVRDMGVAHRIMRGWILTFPCCFALGFFLARILHSLV